jgi:hypothetical protein
MSYASTSVGQACWESQPPGFAEHLHGNVPIHVSQLGCDVLRVANFPEFARPELKCLSAH